MTESPWRRFLGMNIKGTPAMSAQKVRHDLNVAREKCSVLVLQEFKWPWYWRVADKVMDPRWASRPSFDVGTEHPVRGAQAVMWRSRRWRRKKTLVRKLHDGEAKISDTRYLRAVRLAEKESGLECWFGTTHFVVGGDLAGDPVRRRQMMAEDFNALDEFLAIMVRSGHPIVFQMDGNIRRSSSIYQSFRALLQKYNAKVHGEPGVEWLFTINGDDVWVEVKDDWTVPTSQLETDHEGRGITFRLVFRK